METRLLDSVFGTYDDVTFTLVQWWDLDDEVTVRVTVKYNKHGWEGSTAEAVMIADTDNGGKDTDLSIVQFPSSWWTLDIDGIGMQGLLSTVATTLIVRMGVVLENLDA